MKCPFCGSFDNKVMDSRFRKEGNVIRRRRLCQSCDKRFTTYERVEDVMPLVIKKDGTREPFDSQKILSGIKKACQKRPVSLDQMEEIVAAIEQYFQDKGDREIQSRDIGEMVMRNLHSLDKVAYVRFASVYRSFKDLSQFMTELKELLEEKVKA